MPLSESKIREVSRIVGEEFMLQRIFRHANK
jgi:hypothetical protein